LLSSLASEAVRKENIDWAGLLEDEPDAALGNGGLGRLAACFLDSMATMQLPAMGYGLRYEYGIFKQSIQDGWQREKPDNWLRRQDPWEVARPHERVEVKLNCSFEVAGGSLRAIPGRPTSLIGIPFDRPVAGYGGKTISTLRLWAASAPDFFDFQAFSHGDFVAAVAETLEAESLTRVLYPDDSTSMGQGLRFVQEYFLVACSLADMVRRFRAANADWNAFPEKIAIQRQEKTRATFETARPHRAESCLRRGRSSKAEFIQPEVVNATGDRGGHAVEHQRFQPVPFRGPAGRPARVRSSTISCVSRYLAISEANWTLALVARREQGHTHVCWKENCTSAFLSRGSVKSARQSVDILHSAPELRTFRSDKL
jgi:hypothetical protein